MMDLTLLRPLTGALIGYITNYIAIRMLFRPRKAKYIFGWKIPFTPGLIPKEKPRIAASIGEAISRNLMNREVIERSLLSERMIERIGSAFDSFIVTQSQNLEPLELFLRRFLTEADIHYLRTATTEGLAERISETLTRTPAGDRIAAIVVDHFTAEVGSTFLGRIGADKAINLIAAPLRRQLAGHIDRMLADKSADIATELIDNQLSSLLATPVATLLEGRGEQLGRLRQALLDLYVRLITTQLPRILEAIDISGIIEQRINEMDVAETEHLILRVMNRELTAIVWLGALLGFIMGCINLLL